MQQTKCPICNGTGLIISEPFEPTSSCFCADGSVIERNGQLEAEINEGVFTPLEPVIAYLEDMQLDHELRRIVAVA